jgi:hypothetical protein
VTSRSEEDDETSWTDADRTATSLARPRKMDALPLYSQYIDIPPLNTIHGIFSEPARGPRQVPAPAYPIIALSCACPCFFTCLSVSLPFSLPLDYRRHCGPSHRRSLPLPDLDLHPRLFTVGSTTCLASSFLPSNSVDASSSIASSWPHSLASAYRQLTSRPKVMTESQPGRRAACPPRNRRRVLCPAR